MNWAKIKLGLWSAIGGAIALAIVGFSWGGWVTGATAQERATKMASAAMIDRLAPLCLAQFNHDPEKDEKLEALQQTNTWQRKDYVEKQGWATITGESEPDSSVAIECANRILKISS
jgi:pimeloyl-ACP methyl ester carboxylesterase